MSRPLDRPFGYRLRFRWESADLAVTMDRWRRGGFIVSEESVVLFPSLRVEIVPANRPVEALAQEADEPAAPEQAADDVGSVRIARHPNGVTDLVAVGWATIELERFMTGDGPPLWERARDDPHLGAYALRLRGPSDGIAAVLLEPSTEGRLSAALARRGEGPVVFYLGTAAGGLPAVTDAVRAAGGSTTVIAPGPLGPSALLNGGPASGPHLIVVEPELR